MGSFGEHLRRQRETRGVSLEQIVATTKISRRLLQALEDEQFELLPGGIFNKSYVRAYAKCVGLNEDEAVNEYLDAAREAPPDTRVIAQQHASLHSDRRPERPGFPLIPVLVLLVVAIAGAAGWKLYQDHLRERAEQASRSPGVAPADTPSQSAPATETVPAAGNPAASQQGASPAASNTQPQSQPGNMASAATPARPTESRAEAAAGGAFEITVRPKDRAWVSIKADGNYVVRGIIKPPDVRTIHATSQVVFFTGNAGAVEVAFDGKNVPVAGGPNAEQILVFDSHGLLPNPPAPKSPTRDAPISEAPTQ